MYAAVLAHWAAHGVSPTARGLADDLGYSGPASAAKHLRALTSKGWLVPAARGASRAILPADLKPGVEAEARRLLRQLAGPDPSEGV